MKYIRLVIFCIAAAVTLALASAGMADDIPTVTVNVSNTPVRGQVALEKTGLQLIRFEDREDEYGNTYMKPVFTNGYLAGAVFEIHADEDITGKEGTVYYHKDELVETLTTGNTGAVRSKQLPLGKYYLTEVSAPDGYVFSREPYRLTLAAIDHQTAVVEVKVSASNTYLPVRVTIDKQKEETQIKTLPGGMIHQTLETVPGEGFTFGLFNAEVITYADSQKLPADTLVATGMTDKNGQMSFTGLFPHGEYYVKELSVPAGWRLDPEKHPVTLTPAHKAADEDVIIAAVPPILNRLIYTPITITKTDITGETGLPGALIEVYNADEQIIYREYTDANGQIPNIPIVPGTYTFRETYAPEGYALNTEVKTFTVGADGTVTGETRIANELNRVYLVKNKENNEPLPGAIFGLFDKDDQKIMEAMSDDSGIVEFRGIPYGEYTIREIAAPYGYHICTDEWKISIDGTYLNPVKELAIVIDTDAPGQIRILKLDELDSHVISGVQFDVYSVNPDGSEGDLVTTMTTDDNGEAVSDKLFPGDYIVREHGTPTGYIERVWSEKVTVAMDETVSVTVTNMPIQGVIRILKTDDETGKGLPGAVFTVTRVSGLPSHKGEGDGEIVAVLTTDINGYAETPPLTWGEYQVTETHVPDDYIDKQYTVTVKVPSGD